MNFIDKKIKDLEIKLTSDDSFTVASRKKRDEPESVFKKTISPNGMINDQSITHLTF